MHQRQLINNECQSKHAKTDMMYQERSPFLMCCLSKLPIMHSTVISDVKFFLCLRYYLIHLITCTILCASIILLKDEIRCGLPSGIIALVQHREIFPPCAIEFCPESIALDYQDQRRPLF